MVVSFRPLSSSRRLSWLSPDLPLLRLNHVSLATSTPLLPALLAAKYLFMREDVSFPPLALLYYGPYLVLEWRNKFFCL